MKYSIYIGDEQDDTKSFKVGSVKWTGSHSDLVTEILALSGIGRAYINEALDEITIICHGETDRQNLSKKLIPTLKSYFEFDDDPLQL